MFLLGCAPGFDLVVAFDLVGGCALGLIVFLFDWALGLSCVRSILFFFCGLFV